MLPALLHLLLQCRKTQRVTATQRHGITGTRRCQLPSAWAGMPGWERAWESDVPKTAVLTLSILLHGKMESKYE